mgnify:CR=1 FL=1
MTVISPRRAGKPPLVVTDRMARRAFRADVESDKFTDTIIAALDHGMIKYPDVEGFAELAVIRRDKTGRVLDSWTIGGEKLRIMQGKAPADGTR